MCVCVYICIHIYLYIYIYIYILWGEKGGMSGQPRNRSVGMN